MCVSINDIHSGSVFDLFCSSSLLDIFVVRGLNHVTQTG